MLSYKSRGATRKGQGRGETGGWWEWRVVGWQGYKIRIYVCIASRILDPLSQESAVLEMELFESAFQPRLCVQVVSRSESNTVPYQYLIIFISPKFIRLLYIIYQYIYKNKNRDFWKIYAIFNYINLVQKSSLKDARFANILRKISKISETPCIRSAMQTRAPAWCEIDRKRLLRHTACCFLLLSPRHPTESHTVPPIHPLRPPSYVFLSRRIPISHIILFAANPVLHLPSLPEPSFWHQTDYYARIVLGLYGCRCQRNVAVYIRHWRVLFASWTSRRIWRCVKSYKCTSKRTARATADKYKPKSLSLSIYYKMQIPVKYLSKEIIKPPNLRKRCIFTYPQPTSVCISISLKFITCQNPVYIVFKINCSVNVKYDIISK